MEVERDDGWTQARRCLEAMGETEDVATRVSLWRAALKFANRDKASDARGGDFARASLAW